MTGQMGQRLNQLAESKKRGEADLKKRTLDEAIQKADADVQAILSNGDVREILMDPEIKEFLEVKTGKLGSTNHTLSDMPVVLACKVKKLIELGLLRVE
eukprot:Clim_evm22s152 gene=Clim_evmTU22s152